MTRIFSARQGGAVLASVLFLMTALCMLAVGATRAMLADARCARHDSERQLALSAAEAALNDAERDIDGAAGPSAARTAIFAAADASAFVVNCKGTGAQRGLCQQVLGAAPPAWQRADLRNLHSVAYGQFSGRSMAVGSPALPAQSPRYLIEYLPVAGAAPRYRITAIGFGTELNNLVVLQSYYERANGGSPGRRLGWREIANWPALHLAAA